MKRIFKAALIVLITVVMLLTVAAGMYWYNWKKNKPAEAVLVEALPEKAKIGEPVNINLKVQTPWYRHLEDPVVLEDAPENMAISGDVSIEREAYNLKGSLWNVNMQVLMFEEGKYEKIKVAVPLSADREKKQKFLSVQLPAMEASLSGIERNSIIEVKSELDESALQAKEEILAEKSNLWLWFMGAGVLAALAAIPFFLRKRNPAKVKVLTAWETALQKLAALEKEADLNDEVFFVQLTDILRQYIEKRFSLPATEKTSEEFIQEVRRDSILTEKQQLALENFLATADLVKFARMSANREQRDSCLKTADDFVHETVPKQEGAA